jgi:hypothetical protein
LLFCWPLIITRASQQFPLSRRNVGIVKKPHDSAPPETPAITKTLAAHVGSFLANSPFVKAQNLRKLFQRQYVVRLIIHSWSCRI